MKNVQTPAILEGVSTKKDGSLSLRFSTQELSNEEKITLMGYLQTFGWLLFSVTQQTDLDIPKDKAPNRDGKSPSQRLRSRMYVYFTEAKRGEPHEFEMWYERQLDHIGSEYLDRLEGL